MMPLRGRSSKNIPMTTWFLFSWIICAFFMFYYWYFFVQKNIAGVVDFGWTSNFSIIVLWLYYSKFNLSLSQGLLSLMYLIWSLRLSTHIFIRLKQNGEDPRYFEYKQKWSKFTFFIFFQFQAFLNAVLSLPLFLVFHQDTDLSTIQYLALALWGLALAGETLADHQLKVFTSLKANRGRTCRQGLWRYSRHPNYFFEWLIWVAFALYALPLETGYLGLLSPLLMWIFLNKITGIPPAEKRSLQSRGDDYRDYQQKTSAFFPWFSKEPL